MPKRTSHSHRSSSTSNPVASFLRKPAVQILIVLAVVVTIVMLVLSSRTPAVNASSLPAEVNTTQAYELYQQKSAYFVDVREQSEWDSFHIPDTNLIPLGELPNRLAEVPKDRPIVVVCRTGHRSASGRDILKQAGYTNVTSMAGGVTEWRTNGFPIAP